MFHRQAGSSTGAAGAGREKAHAGTALGKPIRIQRTEFHGIFLQSFPP